PITYAIGTDVTDERSMQRRTLRAERLAAVGTLAAGLAHEVRNPLNSATLQLQVLRRRIEKGNTAPAGLIPVVEIVHDEIRRLERLVNDFLAFARPSPLTVAQADLDGLVQSVLEQVRPELRQAQIRLRPELRGEVQVEVDPERLRQVLLNLMRNALEAMSEGGALTVRTLPTDPEGFAGVEIEDNGPGVSEDAPIFDAFYTTKEAGTGLGLAIVHRIIEEHGGQISVESKPGRTVFRLRLPCAR
ncbi:MAG TPA: ATP-binding protein, partial [Polyangiaceae bacterium]|nr:ATP-binding protein [Polyangiaceae bacterium]